MIIEIRDIPNQQIKHLKVDIEFEDSSIQTVNKLFVPTDKVEPWEVPIIEKPTEVPNRPAKVAFNMDETL